MRFTTKNWDSVKNPDGTYDEERIKEIEELERTMDFRLQVAIQANEIEVARIEHLKITLQGPLNNKISYNAYIGNQILKRQQYLMDKIAVMKRLRKLIVKNVHFYGHSYENFLIYIQYYLGTIEPKDLSLEVLKNEQ